MKKIFICLTLLTLICLILPTIFAIDVEVQKKSESEVYIKEIKNPVIYDLEIKNNGIAGEFEIYNLLGFGMSPENISLESGEIKEIELVVTPSTDFNYPGNYIFSYFVRAKDNSEIEGKLTFEIVELKNAFEVGSGEVNSTENSLKIFIKNKKNFNFGQMKAKFSSVFFNFEKTFELSPYEKKEFGVELNKEDFNKLMAGFYNLEAEIEVKGLQANIEGVIKFPEQDIVKTTSEKYGFIIYTQVIEKINEGNVIAKVNTTIKKNIISRLFTGFNVQPDNVERKGVDVYYTWDREIKPGETLKIIVRTNWLFPLLIVLFIITIVVLANQYIKTDLVLKKKISFVKAKGGEFALKVTVLVHAKRYLENVNVIDRLPPLVKIYERFGTERPSRIDEKNKILGWNFEKLEAGEVRVISYIIYSRIGVMGKFALPSARATYEREGEIKESTSNKAFFVTEQRKEYID